MQTTKENKLPPKVSLQELLASPAPSVASSPTTTQTRRTTSNSNDLANSNSNSNSDESVFREPRGPRGRANGFGEEDMKGYESEEAKPGSALGGLGLGLRVELEELRNLDEILLEGEGAECEVEHGA